MYDNRQAYPWMELFIRSERLERLAKVIMDFCDMNCRYASRPKQEALDGSGSCRTFQALYCKKRGRLVYKNAPCTEKETQGVKKRS
jgi:hypothetical protein